MNVFGVSGLPGSGKSFVSELTLKRNGVIISMGDIVREEAKKRGEDSQKTATSLREEFGQYIVAELTIEKIKKIDNNELILVEGIRSPYEVKLFKENFKDFKILSIFTNRDTRFKRLQMRNREDDSAYYENFLIRDKRELDFGIGNVIAESDEIIINNENLEEYEKKINEFLDEVISL